MVPAEGYSLTHAKAAIEDADWVSGDHRIEGTIVAVGPNVKPFESAAGADRHGADAGRGAGCADGGEADRSRAARDRRARAELVEREATEASSAGAASRAWATRPTVTDTEADEMEEHLRGLGYIE